MALIRPRLNDYHGLAFTQNEVDFAIPFLDEDIPLYVDPFLLWRSPSLQDNALHAAVVDSLNHVGRLALSGREATAREHLVRASECAEVGLGVSKTRRGARIGEGVAEAVLSTFRDVPQLRASGFSHIEELQLLVDGVSKDRISDIACSFAKSWLIDYTIDQSTKHGIPSSRVEVKDVYSYREHRFRDERGVDLPTNPETGAPVLLVPKRWLRRVPWINFDEFSTNLKLESDLGEEEFASRRVAVLNYNRHNYGAVQAYTSRKEVAREDCHNDPLFAPIPVRSAKGKLSTIKALPTGKTDNADRKYEDAVCQLMASLLYPDLDFAAEQSRTDSGVLIRDLIFYNNRSLDFLIDIYQDFGSRQIVFELKNVEKIEREHIAQLNRYLNDNLGRFGVIITRNPLSKAIYKSTIDLWSGQRRCILALTDEDLALAVSVFESRQRSPVEVLKRAYIDFIRACPS